MQRAGMRKRWRWREATHVAEQAASADDQQLARAWGVPPVVARLLHARGVGTREQAQRFLSPKLSDLQDPAAIAGLDTAAGRIAAAIAERRPIVVYGDYDVDGVTASAILWHVLRQAGARVQTYVPHRLDEGYGLNREALAYLARELSDASATSEAESATGVSANGKPLVISVDCGIAATAEADYARELGLELIITDHHHFDAEALPEASALVHPRLGESDGDQDASRAHSAEADHQHALHRCRDLCGAGVAFKLAWQLAKHHCQTDRLPEDFKRLLVDLLSYVALGTVADVVPLVEANRVLTIFGLGRIKQTRFAGLNAMIDAARLRDERLDAYHVGFVLGPRLNACGRMGHAREAVRLLTTDDADEASELATFLTKENDRRRSTERAIFDEAKQLVETEGHASDDQRAIVLAKEDWHPGVIGIVASRLVETYARPVVMLSCENGTAKGSARSVDGLHIHEAFSACGEHLTGFGGHAMAAGLSLPTERVSDFRDALVGFVNERLGVDDLTRVVEIDAAVTLEQCKLNVFDQVSRLAPFGRGNPTPRLLLERVTIDQPPQRVGQEGKHLSLLVRQERACVKAIGFQMGQLAEHLPAGATVDLVFEPSVNTYRGTRRPELQLIDVQISAEPRSADREPSRTGEITVSA